MSERKRFEAWAVKPPREWNVTRSGYKSAWPGQYVYHVQCAWEAWQAACPEAWQCVPVEPTAEMRRRALCCNDFERGGLGSVDEFNSEIYLAMLSDAPKPEDVE